MFNNKFLVIGDVILDQYTSYEIKKISPEAPVPILKKIGIDNRAGGAAIVAVNLKKLGNDVTILGVIGRDYNGKLIKKILKENKVKIKIFEESKLNTIFKDRHIVNNQQIARIDHDSDWSKYSQHIKSKLSEMISNFDAVILSDYNKGTLHNIAELIKIINKEKKIIFVDPKFKKLSQYKNIDFITPNLEEWEFISDGISINNKKKIHEIQKAFNIKNLIITLGKNGMLLFYNNKMTKLNTEAKNVYDVSGAGDTVISTLAHSYIIKKNIEESLKLANYAASCVISKFGTSYVTKKEIDQYIHQGNKVFITKDIKNIRDTYKTIIFTNGCFDIIHSGHIGLLKKAKNLGGLLIVGLNSDESIKKIKGHNRPINNLDNRIKVLESIKYVDKIIVFNETTPINLIKAIKPKFLVKGSDYKNKNIIGANFVKSYNGQVKIFKNIEKISTSMIIDKIKNF